MFTIANNGIITVTKGDAFEVPLFINAGTELNPIRYELNNKDYVVLSVAKPNQEFESGVILKKLTIDDLNENGDVTIKFLSSDTNKLEPDLYYYRVKLYLYNTSIDDYDIDTIITRTKFIVVK